MHERLRRHEHVSGINDELRALGARIPRRARPARLGSIDAPQERRAERAERCGVPLRLLADTRIRRTTAPGAEHAEHRASGPAVPADTRIRRSAAIDRFADNIGAEAFTVGRDIFMRSDASPEALRHELHHARDRESPWQPVIRRRGVRSNLAAGDDRFEKFIASTENVRELYETAASDTYSLYKPVTGKSDLHYSEGSVKGPKGGGRKRKGDNAQFLRRAEALSGWANTAADSAERLYAELRGVRRQFADDEYLDFTMGDDTKLYPDAEMMTANGLGALESKHVTSPAQGAVDKHVEAVTAQLEKRDTSMHGARYTMWLASITIANERNPWPYTPAVVAKMKKMPTKSKVVAEMTTRAAKYDLSKTRNVQFQVVVTASKYLPTGTYEFEV